MSYTWSHELDNTSSDHAGTGVDDSHLSRWYGTGDLNRTQMLVMNYVYDLPFFANSSRGIARQTLGGWRISGITTFYSGQPINVGCGISGFNTGIGEGVQCTRLALSKSRRVSSTIPSSGRP